MDKYVVLEYLAEGGMGAIYLGKKLGAGGFEKEVVLKQLLPEFTQQPEFIDLFLREARISATLDHANIVHTIDLVRAGDEYFIVMEYVRGGDLRTLLKRAKRRKKRMLPAVGLFIARETLSALNYAHNKIGSDGRALGLIHRDVSPSNILVSGTGEVKLTDFGIAKASTHRSVFYRVRGKVGYMSPEQARNEPLDNRSDLYSVAVCLYEMLTGERLFVAAGLTTSADEMYSQPVPAVSRKRPDLPKDLDKVMFTALSVDQRGRYQTAGEFQEAILRAAHKNGLMIGPSDLSKNLQDVCGAVEEWGSTEVKESDPRGTEAYALMGSQGPGTDKIRLADILADGESEAGRDYPDVKSPTHDSGEIRSDLDDYLEEIMEDEPDGDWARAARQRPGVERLPKPEIKRRLETQPARLEGLELTSIIRADDLVHQGSQPLIDVATPEQGNRAAPPPPRKRDSIDFPSLAPPPGQSIPAPAPAPPPKAAKPASVPPPSRSKPPAPRLPTSSPLVPTDQVRPISESKPRPSRRRPQKSYTVTWVIAGLILAAGVGIALAIGLSGPSIEEPKTAPRARPEGPVVTNANKAQLTVESEPSGARVIIDGSARCDTPCTVDGLTTSVPLVVKVQKDGYLPWSTLVDLGQLESPKRMANLRPRPRSSSRVGQVLIKAPTPCNVLVNGKAIGHVTTDGPLTLPPGDVELTALAASGASGRVRVTIEAGKTVETYVSLP